LLQLPPLLFWPAVDLRSNLDVVPELRGVALALNERRWGPEQGGPVNFKQAQFRSVNFSYAVLPDANFEYAVLDRLEVDEARQRADVARRRAEELAWAKVPKNPTRRALRAYLRAHGDGKYVAAAKRQIAAMRARRTQAIKRRANKEALANQLRKNRAYWQN